VEPTIPAGGVEDLAGNTNIASTSTDNSVAYDATKPDVTIDQAGEQLDPTNSSPVLFTAVFDEPIDDATFTSADVSVGGTAATSGVGVTEVAPNDDTTFEVAIVVTGDGTVEPTIPAGGVEDLAGNTNTASTSTDNSTTVDTELPSVDVVTALPPTLADATAGTDAFRVTVVFDETMDDGTPPTFAFSPDVTAGGVATLSGGSGAWSTTDVEDDTFTMTYDVTDRNVDIDSVTVDVTGAEDLAGNGQADYVAEHEFRIDTENPAITRITSATADGYYGAGAVIDVTVTFSEDVTLVGGTLDVTVDTPTDIVSVSAFGSAAEASSAYTIAVGDNSCDLDAIGVALVGGTLRDDAGNDAAVSLPATTIADGSEITVDTTGPAIAWIEGFPTATQDMDADCSLGFPIEIRVIDNCGIAAADLGIAVTPMADVDAANALTKSQISETRVDITGTVTVSNPTSCPASVDLDIDAEDLAGNAADTSNDTVTVSDISAPTFSWIADLPDTDQLMDEDCSLTFPVEVLVEDNCCLDAANVTVTVSDPADVTVAHTLTKTQVNANTVRVAGEIAVSALTDGEATADLELDATDCCGNASTANDPVTVVDDVAPTISGFAVTPDDGLFNGHCEETVTVYAIVHDNCCLDAGNVVVTPSVTNASWKDSTIGAAQNGPNEAIVSGTIAIHSLTGCPATLEIEIDATDCGGNHDDWTEDAQVEDEIIPVIHDLRVDEHVVVDDCCEAVVTFDGYVTDNCCVASGGFAIGVTNPTSDATVDFTQAADVTFTQGEQGRVDFAGEIAVSALTDGAATVNLGIDATDCCGNPSTANDLVTVVDDVAPTISGFAVTPDDGLFDGHCEESVTVYAVVHDNCCLDAGNVVVTPSVTNASLMSSTITAAQNGSNEVIVSGTIVVHSLTGYPAKLEIEIDATDCGGNHYDWTEDAQVEDDIIPVIHDLRVDEHVVVSDCCEAVVTFDGYVIDNCCVSRGGIAIVVTNPTSDATVDFTQPIDVTFTQGEQGRVDFAGEIAVRCLKDCSADIVVTVDAADCCENDAVAGISNPDPTDPEYNGGDVYDETLPIPRDDPRQDLTRAGSAVIDPLVEVYEDSLGVVRLTLREDTPVRIDILANDADNCSCRCDTGNHPFDPCGGCGACPSCCATMFLHEIVSPPAYGTATIEDAEGDCGGGSVIRYAPDRGQVGPDEFTYRIRDACGNVSDVIATVYVQVVEQTVVEDVFPTTCIGQPVSFTVTGTDLWVDGGDPGRIPFVFSVVAAPAHGVLSGDLGKTVYGTSGALGTATIELTYTPALGYAGEDVAIVRFADPFGEFTDARIRVAVVECTPPPTERVSILLEKGGGSLSILVPTTLEGGDDAVDLTSADGAPVSGSVAIEWDTTVGRFIVMMDGAVLEPGLYVLTIPLGNGETVELPIEVVAGEAE